MKIMMYTLVQIAYSQFQKALSPCTVSIASLEIFGHLWLQKNLPTMVTRCEAPSEGFVQVPCSAGAVSEHEPMGVDFTVIKHKETMVKVAWWKYGVQIKVSTCVSDRYFVEVRILKAISM